MIKSDRISQVQIYDHMNDEQIEKKNELHCI